jgi:hypothetical protein
MIFPAFYTMRKKLAKIASALKSVGSFSASTETSGFSLKVRWILSVCCLSCLGVSRQGQGQQRGEGKNHWPWERGKG